MKLILFLSILFSFSALAWEAKVEMSPVLEMSLQLSCEKEDSLCAGLCGNSLSCVIESGSCKNCIGANSIVSHFYREVGRLYQNTQRSLSESATISLLSSGSKFIYLEAQGAFNIYSGLADLRIERHFESLCQGQFFSRPIVLAKLDRRSRVERVSHVICHGDFGGEVFEMSHAGD